MLHGTRVTNHASFERLESTPTHRRLWRVAGAMVIAYVVLQFASAGFTHSLELGDSAAAGAAALVQSSLVKNLAGGYLGLIGFLDFLVVGMLLARLIPGDSETSEWLSSCVGASAITYVAVILATSFAAGAAAIYGGHHGVAVGSATVVNNIRSFGFILGTSLVGMFVLSVSAAGRISGELPRWLSYSGALVGAFCIIAIPGARLGLVNGANMLWFIWFVALGVVALRRGTRTSGDIVGSATMQA